MFLFLFVFVVFVVFVVVVVVFVIVFVVAVVVGFFVIVSRTSLQRIPLPFSSYNMCKFCFSKVVQTQIFIASHVRVGSTSL